MCSLLCDSDHVEGVRKYASLLSEFLAKFSWLTDSYVLDYFVDKQWQKLPPSWQNALFDVQPDQVSSWLKTGIPAGNSTVWPLSLLCLAPAAKLLSLSRHAVGSPAHIPIFSTVDSCWASGPISHQEWPSFDPCSNRNMTHAFRKHVKSKKQHEITRLALVVELLAHKCGCRHVMDVGSGQGHLARLLALDRNLGVATVDLVGSHLSSAKRFDDQAVLHFKKKSGESAEGGDPKLRGGSQIPPQHVKLEVSMTTTPDQLEEVANRVWNKLGPRIDKFVLVGLHTCGDLGSSIVRLFAQTPAVEALVSVGCCYMKLSCDRSRDEPMGYPMSRHVLSLGERAELSYQAREVACHALEVYLSRLREEPSLLKIHCYRALLETVIVRSYADRKHSGLGSVKHAAAMTFAEYARKALRKFPLPIPEEELSAPELQSLLGEWKRVVLFYSLRLLLAPVVESLVLTDRALYLWEQGISSCLVPLFDPTLSPRNIVLLAFKAGS